MNALRKLFLPAILLLLLILIFWSFTFGSLSAAKSGPAKHTMLNHNVWNEFLPLYQYSFERMRRGELALWNPYQACGVPALATLQPGTFYPPNWLYCFINVSSGLKWLSILHLFWAGFWMALLYRELFPGSSPFASLFASAGYVFSGPLAVLVWWPGNLYAASWLPCLLFVGERLIQKRLWKWTALLSIMVALAFLGGYVQNTFYECLLLCGFMLLRMSQLYLVSRRWRELTVVLLLSAAAAVVALLLISPQLLPTMELSALSERRPGALTVASSHVFGVDFFSLKTLLRDSFLFDSLNYNYISFFVLMGAVVSFLDRKNRTLIIFFASAGLLTLLLSLGSNTPLYPFYFEHIPTGNWFTGPSRWRLITLFCMCIIGARGINILMDEFSRGASIKKSRTVSFGISLSVGLALVAVGFLYSMKDTPLTRQMLIDPPFFFPFQYAGLILGILLLRRNYVSATTLRLCLISVIFIEAVFAHRYLEPFPSSTNSPYNMAAVNFLRKRAGALRVHLENNDLNARVFPEKSASLFKFYATTDWEPMSLLRYRMFIRAMQGDPPSWSGELYGHFQLWSNKAFFPMFNLLSPKYIVISDGAPDVFQLPTEQRPFVWSEGFPEVEFPLVGEFDGVKIYENPSCLPRAVFSPRFKVCQDDILALDLLSRTSFDPIHSPTVDSVPDLPVDGFTTRHEESKIEITLLADERITCRVDAKSNGILWTTDAYYPGWKVKVDGEEASLLNVNYLFRGVALPSGVHTVEFYYECRTLRLGALLFVCSLLIISLGFAIQRRTQYSP